MSPSTNYQSAANLKRQKTVPNIIEEEDKEMKIEEQHFYAKKHLNDDNILSEYKPKTLKTKELEEWARKLPKQILDALDHPTGKKKIDKIKWQGEIVF